MDPISQAVLGAALPQSVMSGRDARGSAPLNNQSSAASENQASRGVAGVRALQMAIIGALAGMAPDLDVLIRSSSDPLLFLEYHRQFTHSLIFIPFGAALCALAFWPFLRRTWSYTQVWLVALLGYATHGLLDACTTYGTLLLWPFSDARIAWNNVSVIDPLFTLPLLIGVVLAVRRRSKWPARLGLLWGVAYLGLGFVQQDRAETVGARLAAERGHTGAVVSAKPSFGNLLVWKLIYEYDGRFWVDAVRAGADLRVIEGDSVPILDVEQHLPWLDHETQQAKDLERFRWFSSNYLAIDLERPNFIVDMRYSMLPNEIRGLWGIQLSPDAEPDAHVAYEVRRDTRDRVKKFMAMITLPEDGFPAPPQRRSDAPPVPDAAARSSGHQP